MNRVTKRTWLMSVFILVLVLGMVIFLGEYAARARSWVVFPGSPHVYNNTTSGLVPLRTGRELSCWTLPVNVIMPRMRMSGNPHCTGWVTGRAT